MGVGAGPVGRARTHLRQLQFSELAAQPAERGGFRDPLEVAREKTGWILANHHPANCLNLRGLAKDPGLPKFPEIFGLHSAAIAAYPMYRGIARLLGMNVHPPTETIAEEIEALINQSEAVAESLVYGDPSGVTALVHLKPEVLESLYGRVVAIKRCQLFVALVLA